MAEIKTPVRQCVYAGRHAVFDAADRFVAHGRNEETAAAIASALNLNTDLLSALKGLRDEDYQSACERLEFGPGDWEARQLVDERQAAADAVIARAVEVSNG